MASIGKMGRPMAEVEIQRRDQLTSCRDLSDRPRLASQHAQTRRITPSNNQFYPTVQNHLHSVNSHAYQKGQADCTVSEREIVLVNLLNTQVPPRFCQILPQQEKHFLADTASTRMIIFKM